jgi:hypothetical protein
MVSESKAECFSLLLIINVMLLVWFPISLYFGYQKYIEFPKTQQETRCRINETNAMKLFNENFQAIWTVDFNDSESEKRSEIFVNSYKTFTDAIEATINQYKVRKNFHEKQILLRISKETILLFQIGQVYKCYFNTNKPYDVLWTIDDKLNQGRKFLIIAFILGILFLITWIIPIGYFFHKWYLIRSKKNVNKLHLYTKQLT